MICIFKYDCIDPQTLYQSAEFSLLRNPMACGCWVGYSIETVASPCQKYLQMGYYQSCLCPQRSTKNFTNEDSLDFQLPLFERQINCFPDKETFINIDSDKVTHMIQPRTSINFIDSRDGMVKAIYFPHEQALIMSFAGQPVGEIERKPGITAPSE